MLIPTSLVGSYPQPDWLIDRDKLGRQTCPRECGSKLCGASRRSGWKQAQDDATLLAIHDQERAGIDIVTDGEIRRESYSNRFATALEGSIPNVGSVIGSQPARATPVPRVVGKIRRKGAVELRDAEFLLRHRRRARPRSPPAPPFTLSAAMRRTGSTRTRRTAMDFAVAVNEELAPR